MKKIALFVCGMMLFLTFPVCAEESTEFQTDGTIIIESNLTSGNDEKNATITVVNGGAPLLQTDAWLENSGETDIVYFDSAIPSSNGAVSFSFYIDENGIYDVYIADPLTENPVKQTIKFVNTDTLQSARQAIVDAKNGSGVTAALIANETMNLGLFDAAGIYEEIFTKADLSETAELVSEADVTADNADRTVKKALLITMLNAGEVSDIDKFSDLLGIGDEKIAGYYKKGRADLLLNQFISSVADFDTKLTDSIILSTVNNNNGTGEVKNILTDFCNYIGVEKSKITNTLVTAVVAHNDFTSTNELKRFIDDYTPPSTGGSGGGGGGVAGGSNSGNVFVNPSDSAGQTAEIEIFSDISDVPWARQAIEELYRKNIVNGREFSKFYPNDSVLREEFVKMLVVAFDLQLVTESMPFEDIVSDDWCYEYVCSAYASGAVNGIADTLFGKGENITRQDLCTMSYRMLQACGIEIPIKLEEKEFIDQDQIADYAVEAIKAMQCAGIVQGDEAGAFRPNGFATRAEAAQIVYGITNLLEI